MKKITGYLKNSTNVFFLISFLGIVSFGIYGFFEGGKALDWIALENNPKLNFIDFFMHIYNVADRHAVYTHNSGQIASFPPLAYALYYFFYKLIFREKYVPSDMFEAMDMPHGMFVFLYYSIFVSVLLFIAILICRKTGKNDLKRPVMLFCALMFSAPFFAGAMAQGNTSVLVMIFLLFAVNLRESDDNLKKEIALILIAVSAGMKIYPAIFGLLYLIERRYKEAARLVVYGVLFFFVPFVFFGRIEGFRLWMNNVRTLSQLMEYGRIQFVRGMVYTVLKSITGNDHILAGDIASYLFLAAMLFLCCISKDRYRRLFFLCSIMSFFANYSYRYTLCYLAIPLVMYINDYNEDMESIPFRIVMILYGLIFTIPVWWGVMTGFRSSYGHFTYIMTYAELYIYVCAYILVLFIVFWEIAIRTGARQRSSK